MTGETRAASRPRLQNVMAERGEGHGTKGCTVMITPPRHNVSCPVDGQRCDVARALGARRSGQLGASFEALAELLPCTHCARRLSGDAANLAGVRLGKHQRRVLLAAPSPDCEPAIVHAKRSSRSAAEAHRRALRQLARCGLVETPTKPVEIETKAMAWSWGDHFSRTRVGERVKRRYRCRAVVRTPLGQAVVERLRPTLEAGGSIRWRLHEKALVEMASQLPTELVARFVRAVRKKQGFYQWRLAVVSLFRGLRRPRASTHDETTWGRTVDGPP